MALQDTYQARRDKDGKEEPIKVSISNALRLAKDQNLQIRIKNSYGLFVVELNPQSNIEETIKYATDKNSIHTTEFNKFNDQITEWKEKRSEELVKELPRYIKRGEEGIMEWIIRMNNAFAFGAYKPEGIYKTLESEADKDILTNENAKNALTELLKGLKDMGGISEKAVFLAREYFADLEKQRGKH